MYKNKRNDIIVGIVLIVASIAVGVRYFYLREHLESLTESVFFLRLAFFLFTIILAGSGIKKLVSAMGSEDNKK